MKTIMCGLMLAGMITGATCYADDSAAIDVYNRMTSLLMGEWSLSPEDMQVDTTGAYKHKAVYPLVGTEVTASAYKLIGKGATLQEDLLPNTAKQMVTMYHCDDFSDCKEIKATHYCAKKNQPEFLLNTEETTANKFVFDCDMKTKLCNSDQDHIHKIILEISDNGTHLKSSYLGRKNQKPNEKNSIYHFDKK